MLDRTWKPPGARGRLGVSLFTILVSLCAVGLLAVLAIPAFFGNPDITLHNACELLLRDVRTAQSRADQLETGAVFHLHRDGWEATTPTGEVLSRRAPEDGIVRVFSENGVFEGVVLERIDFGGDDRFGFDENGLILEGGSLEVVFRGERLRVEIDPIEGLTVTRPDGTVVLGDEPLFGDALRR